MNSSLDEEKATTVRALEFHKFAYQSIVPCDETATALCCHGNRVFAGFESSKIIVYEVSALGNSGYIKQAMFNTVGIPRVIKFCPIATTVVTHEKEPHVAVVDRRVSSYEIGFAKVYVYPFGLWNPDRIDQSLKIVKAGRTTAQHYRGDIIRNAEYEVLEISIKPTSLQSLHDAVINAKCLIDICPIYGNLAIAYNDSITIYRHVIAGVTDNLMDYELIMELVTLVSPLKSIEILGTYLAVGSVGEIQVLRIEEDPSVDNSKKQTSLVNSTHRETDSTTVPEKELDENVHNGHKTNESSAVFNLLALDLERTVMAQLNSKMVAADKKNSFFTSNSDAAVEVVIPKMTFQSSFSEATADFTRERFGPSYFPLGKTVTVIWSTQFEGDQLKFHGVKLPALVIRYLYFKPLKPKRVQMQFLPKYFSQGNVGRSEDDLFHSFCRKNNHEDERIIEKLFILIASPRSGTCVDLTGNVSIVTQFPFAGECIGMCGDENFIYVVYQNYIEVYTSKLFKPNTAMTNFNQLRGTSSPVPQFLVDLWVKQPIFMCGRQNFYSLTKMERSKIVNDSFLLQSVYNMSRFEGSADIKAISTVYSLCKESITECCESMLVQADNLKSVAKSLYLSVLLEVWIFLYNNYNEDCKDMFKSVSTKLLRCVALTNAVSELSMQTATSVSRNSYYSSDMGMTLNTPIIEVPTEVLQFLLDNCDISPLQFFNELCRCAETLQSYSVNASSLNLMISNPDWIVLLLRRVQESPKILKDLLNMAQGCNPQIVTNLLYDSNLRLFKFLSKLEIVDHYNTLHYCSGYVFSSFDKLGKASALSALGSVEELSQTLSTIKVEELMSVVAENASLIFEESSSKLEASSMFDKTDSVATKNSSEMVQYSTHKQTRLANYLFKLHPYFFSSALISLVSVGSITIQDSISFCTGSRADEIEALFKGFSILKNNALKFLLEFLMQGKDQTIRTTEELEMVVECLFKLYILEDSSSVSNLNRSASKDTKVKIESPIYSQTVLLTQSNKSFMYDPNFDWLRLLTPFKGITEELACCVPEKETSLGLRRRRNFNPNMKHTCDSIPCPCVLCRKFLIAVQSLLVTFGTQLSSKTISKLSAWLTEFCRSVDESKKAFFPNYFEGIFLLIELYTNMPRAISTSLRKYDSSIMCALLKALLTSLSFDESVRLYRTVTQGADVFLEAELVILKSICPKMKFREMLKIIPPSRAVEAYTEILSNCSDVAKSRRDTLRYRSSTLKAVDRRTFQHTN